MTEDRADLGARVVETHTATLFFVGEHVYKLKKAVDLGFFDHRTRQARLDACRQEVALNRRLAPDVYHGVVDVVGEDGRPIDHLVDMRRMPEDRRLARCIERGEDLDRTITSIAHAVATLHAGSHADPVHDRLATLAALRRRWTDGFDQLATLDLDGDLRDRLGRMEELALRYLDGRGPLFDQRIADGWIRDGHGDLQAEDIFVLDDGPRILDCIEFGEDYRWGDVLADVAFLAMDLERLGRRDLADRFLALHRELTADRWPASLAHLDVAYRAHVRAKVGILRHAQQGAASVLDPAVDRLVELAIEHLREAQVRLVLVGGLPGTGKSTLAAGLGDHLGAVVLRTDEIRGRIDLGEPFDRYAPAAVTAVYLEMLLEARRLLGLGEHVVLDATWSTDLHRELAREAGRACGADLAELQCVLPRATADARIRARLAEGRDASEATPAVATAMVERFEPWIGAVSVHTDRPPAEVVGATVEGLRGLPVGG